MAIDNIREVSCSCAIAGSCVYESTGFHLGNIGLGVKLLRFITKETFKAPPTAEVKALMPAEIAKVKELIEQGLIYQVPGWYGMSILRLP